MELKILYDNEAEEGFKSGWGFSCLVGDETLFDVGRRLGHVTLQHAQGLR